MGTSTATEARTSYGRSPAETAFPLGKADLRNDRIIIIRGDGRSF